jgi:pre-rRNA-processing protein IPI1
VIVLPEQSMASERAGMAVNKRGLTLRELLQQTVHYNPKVRRGELPLCFCTAHWDTKCTEHTVNPSRLFMLGSLRELCCIFVVVVVEAALNGIKDLVSKHPAELKLHKVAMIEKLQERICDSDKVVRDSLYTILQSLIFPSLKEVPPLPSHQTLRKSFN